MKNLTFLFLFLTGFIFPQTPQAILEDLNNFKPGELIVKLKDNVDAGVTYAESREGMSNTSMQLNKLQTGNYIVLISADKNGGTKHIANKTLIIK